MARDGVISLLIHMHDHFLGSYIVAFAVRNERQPGAPSTKAQANLAWGAVRNHQDYSGKAPGVRDPHRWSHESLGWVEVYRDLW